VDIEKMAASTDGYSFAEIEELKNLLIMHHMDTNSWDWNWAMDQFEVNRQELATRTRRRVGFGQAPYEALQRVPANGNGNGKKEIKHED
jgi:hypothetical protein